MLSCAAIIKKNLHSGNISSDDYDSSTEMPETAEETAVIDSVLHDVHADVDEVVDDDITECTTSRKIQLCTIMTTSA